MKLIAKYPVVEAVMKMKEVRKEVLIPQGIKKVYFVSANPADRHLLQLAIEELGFETEFVFLKSAEEYLELIEKPQFSANPNDILFVDYYLSKRSGLDLLKILRSDCRFKDIPILMMVPAMFEKILEGSYQEGANCCILMPVDFYELISTLKGVLSYWDFMLQ